MNTGKTTATFFVIIGAVCLGILGLPLFGLGPFIAMDWAYKSIREIWRGDKDKRYKYE